MTGASAAYDRRFNGAVERKSPSRREKPANAGPAAEGGFIRACASVGRVRHLRQKSRRRFRRRALLLDGSTCYNRLFLLTRLGLRFFTELRRRSQSEKPEPAVKPAPVLATVSAQRPITRPPPIFKNVAVQVRRERPNPRRTNPNRGTAVAIRTLRRRRQS